MKYETPKLTALTPAINAIQATPNKPPVPLERRWLDERRNRSISRLGKLSKSLTKGGEKP